ncbi:MAG: succinate dehydrogenase cytochrome b subunit [Candidatus Dadabacteria bacterium]|nr:succinate dehydrogenase cytochrome b subunit [Candidatus Dadabacteria bacterium]
MPSVAKKILNALTGIGLVLFLVVHLLGNLTLFSSDPGPFNSYAKTLHDLGWLLTAIEIALLLLFAAHIASSIIITRANRKARNEGYAAQAKGRASATKPVASRNMIYSGIILGAFVVWHVISFRFGPGIAEGYVTEINGVASRDLYAVVYEFFENPLNVLLYTAVMIFLGLHLRHGYWSAFQSLGAIKKKYMPLATAAGYMVAVILSAGFLLIPLWIYFAGRGG